MGCRDNGLSDAAAKDVATTCVRTYRESTAEFSKMKTLELWYYALEPDDLPGMDDMNLRKRVMKRIEQERAKSAAEGIFPKLVEHKGDMPIIKDQLPTIAKLGWFLFVILLSPVIFSGCDSADYKIITSTESPNGEFCFDSTKSAWSVVVGCLLCRSYRYPAEYADIGEASSR